MNKINHLQAASIQPCDLHYAILNKTKIVKEIDLTYVTTNEPEGLDFLGNKLLMFCGQEGGIYELKYK